ncbi:unnamed protein product [Angiostrongylus costaricensis]|uniref:Peptidase A1 domain-containing protein n=1 Tax=Angiostrongylus costaricensis TaxID=334426 RepID=A0A0R3PAY0_ANGCS|nr:unnamed protein product [Angiostrongylus costaricensis]
MPLTLSGKLTTSHSRKKYIDSLLLKINQQAVSSTGTSWIGAPTEIIEAVANQTRAYYDSLNKFYTVDCSTMKSQPDLMFTINNVKYNIPPEEYVLDIGVGDGQASAPPQTQNLLVVNSR